VIIELEDLEGLVASRTTKHAGERADLNGATHTTTRRREQGENTDTH
jgi:hypothetical protein